MGVYGQAMRQAARNLIASHGELVEVRCVSGPPWYRIELAFADGHEIVITEHSGGIDITMMKFGYGGTGTECFWAFLDEAGYKDVSYEQLKTMEGPTVLRKSALLKGIDLLVEICTRDDLLDTQSMWDEAVEDLKQHGEEGSRALASLLDELLRCRAGTIGPVIAAAEEVSPVPELISVLESIASASPLAPTVVGARFRPQIAGAGQIGWTNGTAARIKEMASEAVRSLKSSE